jgi:predicted transcriptional regulator of viral defense system
MTLPLDLQPTNIGIPAWVDSLQANGRYTFTRHEAETATEASHRAVQSSLRRLGAAGRVVAPRRGFYVIVPLEYRATGAPPASWFVDEFMGHLDRSYHVGLLTAASLHGAAHQAPQLFQVVVDLPTRPVEVGRVRMSFVQGRAGMTPVTRMNTATGTMVVATPEGTALELVRHAESCGGLNNVATVLTELVESMDSALLVAAAARGMEKTVLQRAGYLLELIGAHALAEPLSTWLAQQRTFPTALRPDLPTEGADRNRRWMLIINDRVEPDE